MGKNISEKNISDIVDEEKKQSDIHKPEPVKKEDKRYEDPISEDYKLKHRNELGTDILQHENPEPLSDKWMVKKRPIHDW